MYELISEFEPCSYADAVELLGGNQYLKTLEDKIQKFFQSKPKEVKKSNEGVWVDLGIQNLLTIYDPVGKQQIIKGGCIVATNEYYNKKISKIQNELSVHKKEKSKTTKSNQALQLLQAKKVFWETTI